MKIKDAKEITGGLSRPSKMPGFAYNLPATSCKTGSKLRNVPNSVCANCYALKGRYCFPAVKNAMEKRLQALSHPLWVKAMVAQLKSLAKKGHTFFRWHDSGDLQGEWHLRKIYEVCRLTPEIQHWLPTREFQTVLACPSPPDNLTIRISAPLVGSKLSEGLLNKLGCVQSAVVKKENLIDWCGHRICPATSTDSHECGDCRSCWDRKVKVVVYAKH